MGISRADTSSRPLHICLNLPETFFSVPNRFCFTALTESEQRNLGSRKLNESSFSETRTRHPISDVYQSSNGKPSKSKSNQPPLVRYRKQHTVVLRACHQLGGHAQARRGYSEEIRLRRGSMPAVHASREVPCTASGKDAIQGSAGKLRETVGAAACQHPVELKAPVKLIVSLRTEQR